jgi:UDP-N-acetylglucosamine 2-epimerase (non-hydrolysing)
MTVLFVFGTRPEAIKLGPVVDYLRCRANHFRVQVCVTAQHRDLLDQALAIFQIRPDCDLNVMRPGQTLLESTSRILAGLEPVLKAARPDCVAVQGDTVSTFCGALAAFYHHVPVVHIEAGLRTGNLSQPFPEEANRLLTGRLTTLHFAPTEHAAESLRREGVAPDRIIVTGNTGIDALLQVQAKLQAGALPRPVWPAAWQGKQIILVTCHRRESFGPGLQQIFQALTRLARRPGVQLVFPVHPNPEVRGVAEQWVRDQQLTRQVALIEPQPYVDFVDLMSRSYLILTDSGGVQEEAPSLGVPVLVMRETTERPEAITAGTSRLVGVDPEKIVAEASLLLDDPEERTRRCLIHNPYGDGHASARIAQALSSRSLREIWP